MVAAALFVQAVVPAGYMVDGDTSLIVRAHYNNNSQLEYAGLPFAMADFPGVYPFQYSGATDQPDTTIENVAMLAI